MSGAIYFASCSGRVKIGFTCSLRRRIASLSLGCPFPCVLLASVPGGVDAERGLHSALAEWRRHGEWFEKNATLDRLIDAIHAGTVRDGAGAVGFVGGSIAAPDPGTFDELLGLWETPKELSIELDTIYVTAQLMKRRRSVGVNHWPKLITAAAAKGVHLTTDDLLAMRERRKAVA